ncbi:MAG: PorT family protein [Bacteroidales bacterium]|jgi:hypothetical protein|nr:PorT family protein [Bacteroidales bacterium]
MKKLKVSVCLFVCLLYFSGVSAQPGGKKVLNYQQHDHRNIHFGFCLGLNAMDYTITPSTAHYSTDSLLANVSKLSTGFHIQVVSAARLTDMLELRFLPGIAFSSRLLHFYRNNRLYDDKQQLESSYIELPLLLKYKSVRVNNCRGFLVGGFNSRFDLAKTYREDDGIYMDLNLNDICYELGGGFDFYFPYFKLSLEIRGSWGLFNVLKPRSTPRPEFQNAIDKLRSSVYLFSIYIE